MQIPKSITETLGLIAYTLYENQPYIIANLHLILSAVLPIYAGAYSSLSRPSSAAKKPKKKSKDATSDDEDDDEIIQRMEGLAPSDAIVFPIMAGLTLTGLYFLIQWLQNPDLLNKILNWYFATFSVFSVSRMVSDILDLAHSMIFPHEYRDRGVLFHVDAKTRKAVPVTIAPATKIRTHPLPGIISRISLPKGLSNYLWKDRVLPHQKWTFTAIVNPLINAQIKLGIHGLAGLAIGLATVLYYNFVDKPWFLTNTMGFAFAYGALQLMSPTTFATGSLILSALFFYDIYFVFFTPMMVTVAKSLDIPIKLLIPKPADPSKPDEPPGLSMLGLGDVVLPGMLVGLALRFDLFLFYLRKQKQITPKEAKDAKAQADIASDIGNEEADLIAEAETDPITEPDGTLVEKAKPSTGTDNDNDNGTSKNEKLIIVKAPYTPVHTGWGDLFWTSTFIPSLPSFRGKQKSQVETYAPRNVFPKPYFRAALVGYVVGLLVTLVAMNISNHPQPALLYLVPGVVGSIWLTALVRGEMKAAWDFSDAGDEEEEQKDKGKDGEKKEIEGEENDGKNKTIEDKDGENRESAKADAKSKSPNGGGFFSLKRAEQREKASEAFLQKYVSEVPEHDSDGDSEAADEDKKGDKTGDATKGSKTKSKRKSKAKGKTLFLLSITSPLPAYPDIDEEEEVDKTKIGQGKADTGDASNEKDLKENRTWRASKNSGQRGTGSSVDGELEGHADKRMRVK